MRFPYQNKYNVRNYYIVCIRYVPGNHLSLFLHSRKCALGEAIYYKSQWHNMSMAYKLFFYQLELIYSRKKYKKIAFSRVIRPNLNVLVKPRIVFWEINKFMHFKRDFCCTFTRSTCVALNTLIFFYLA